MLVTFVFAINLFLVISIYTQVNVSEQHFSELYFTIFELFEESHPLIDESWWWYIIQTALSIFELNLYSRTCHIMIERWQ